MHGPHAGGPAESRDQHRTDVAYAGPLMRCTACGSEIPAGARFCPACGHSVALAQPEERRIVTVLFADLVGFTSLAERMDPEQVKRLVDHCFEQLVEVVVEFGGRVDKVLGDGMLVLFGAPVAHEDDPERAIRAALRMQQTVAEFVRTSALEGSDDIRMRVGINTGEVLVGTLAGTDYTAMGDVVNTASRLQAAAPPGGVLVGESTHGLTSHTFLFEPVGELTPRGREQSLTGWLALEPTAPPGAARKRRRDVPIVGRHAEITIANAAFDLVTRNRRGVVLHVNGENGVGKSRLVDEVLEHVRNHDDVFLLEGACVPYGESNVWFPIATALSNYLDLDISASPDPPRVAGLAKARSLFPAMADADAERLVEVFVHLLGFPSAIDKMDPAQARSTIHRAVARVFEVRAEQRTMVLSIDDLHWADPMLVDLLDSLVTAVGRHAFLLITAMRPGADVAWPPQTDRVTTLSVNLQPLTRTDTEELATALLEEAPDERLLGALYERSGGNPLFVHELVALREAGGGHRELPDSLRTLIAARLDQLTAEQRQVLENAAVLGTSGTVGALEKFAVELGQPFRPGVLQELDESGLLEIRGRRWEFHSESVRDAAYQTLTKAARAQRHAGVASALAATAAQHDDRAHHIAAAAELVQELGSVDGVPTDITTRAIDLLVTAAERAIDSGSLRMAVRHASRALDLAGDDHGTPRVLARLRIARATAYTEQRNFSGATADIDALQAVAVQLADPTLEAQAYRLRGALHQVAGRIDDARRELGLAVDLLRQSERSDLLAQALRVRGFIEMFGGSLVDAEWFFGEADGLYRSLGDERGMAYIEQHRAWIAFLSGDLHAARIQLTDAAETHERLGDRNGTGWALGLLAFVEFFEGDFEEAERLAEIVTVEAQERGDDWAGAMMDTLLADLRLWQGKLEEAHNLAEKARTRFRKLNDRFGLVQALAPLVRTQVAMGRTAAAQRTSEELLALADTAANGPIPLMAAAGAAMHRGAGQSALALTQRAMAQIAESGGRAFETNLVLAIAHAQLGQLDEALAAIEDVPTHGREHPFTHAATALLMAATGQPQAAIDHADAVERAHGATYLDQVWAYVAAAGAAAQLGDSDRAELAAQAAVARAIGVGDVVAIRLATGAYRTVTGQQHPAHDERTAIGDGWLTLLPLVCGQDIESAETAGAAGSAGE